MEKVRRINGKWINTINLEKSYCIKCMGKDQLLKVLKFFEDYTDYVFQDTKQHVSPKRFLSDSNNNYPIYIATYMEAKTLYTTPVNPFPFSSQLTYSTAFLQQMRVKIDKTNKKGGIKHGNN